MPDLIGISSSIRETHKRVAQLADRSVRVLVTGESGTGKELVAWALHERSLRRGKPFVCVNLGALPDTLAEAELFGVDRGAATDVQARPGCFERANGGTLLLDEIGELPLPLQVRLLRVLQESEVQRVGALRPLKLDVRIIAATNRDLEHEMSAGRFRKDLYYRLHVAHIALSPLRERKEDLPLLVEHLLTKLSAQHGCALRRVNRAAMDLLTLHDWPGNVRELEHALEQALVLCTDEDIGPDALPPALRREARRARTVPVDDITRDEMLRVLRDKRHNITRVAEHLNLSTDTVYRRIGKLGIRLSRARTAAGGAAERSAFVAGPPIHDPSQFFGRAAELSTLLQRLDRLPLHHSAVVGPRRSGKTSLLLRLCHAAGGADAQHQGGSGMLSAPERYRFVLVDLLDPRLRTVDGIARHVLSELGIPAPRPCALETFLDGLDEALSGQRVVLLLDELGAALRGPGPTLPDDLWSGLRALSTRSRGDLAFVVAADQDPMALARRSGLESPFFNLFSHCAELGPLTEAEARQLTASAPQPFPDDDVEWMLTRSGRWPMLLQVLCLQRQRALAEPGEGWRDKALRQMEPYAYLLTGAR